MTNSHQTPSPTALDGLLASLLRGDPLDRRLIKGLGATAIHEAASAHDVLPMVADRLALAPELPEDLREVFLEELHRLTVIDLAAEAELRKLHAAFAAAGVPMLMLKGSHLAYTHYARPDLRSRIDTDVLVAVEQREAADRVLIRDLGYEAPTKLSGDLTATQKLYVKYDNGAAVHMVDLHWRLASPQVFAHVLSFEQLYEAAVPLPALGPAVRVPCDVHAMLIACMHRIAHHHDEAESFKWLFDIHLLASRLSSREWAAFASLALEREISAVCVDSVQRAAQWFDTRVPSSFINDPRWDDARSREATAAYLGTRAKARALIDDLRALPSWSDRLRLLGEHLFPGEAYMRQVYAPGSRQPLPVLYLRRALRGMAPWLR